MYKILNKTFCFDIDGVICSTKKNNYKNSKPNKKVISIINKLYINNKIIIFTARYMGRSKNNPIEAERLAKKFTNFQLKKWGVKYDKVFFGKPSYDYIIDDKSIYMKKFVDAKLIKELNRSIF